MHIKESYVDVQTNVEGKETSMSEKGSPDVACSPAQGANVGQEFLSSIPPSRNILTRMAILEFFFVLPFGYFMTS